MDSRQLTTINVSLPASLKEFVSEQVRAGAYGSVSEYVRMLIRNAWREAGGQETGKANRRNGARVRPRLAARVQQAGRSTTVPATHPEDRGPTSERRAGQHRPQRPARRT